MKFSIFNFQFSIFRLRRGITLIEVLMTAGLTSVVMLLIVYTFISAIRSSDSSFQKFNVSARADGIFNNISQYSLLAVTSPANFSYAGIEYTSDSDTLILQIPSVESNGSIKIGFFDYAVYDLNPLDNTLKELVVPDAQSARQLKNKTVAQNVSNVTFSQTGLAKGKVQNIEITIDSSSFSRTSQYTLSKSIRMRNQNNE